MSKKVNESARALTSTISTSTPNPSTKYNSRPSQAPNLQFEQIPPNPKMPSSTLDKIPQNPIVVPSSEQKNATLINSMENLLQNLSSSSTTNTSQTSTRPLVQITNPNTENIDNAATTRSSPMYPVKMLQQIQKEQAENLPMLQEALNVKKQYNNLASLEPAITGNINDNDVPSSVTPKASLSKYIFPTTIFILLLSNLAVIIINTKGPVRFAMCAMIILTIVIYYFQVKSLFCNILPKTQKIK